MKSSSPCSQHGLGSLTHGNHLETGQAFGSGLGAADPPPPRSPLSSPLTAMGMRRCGLSAWTLSPCPLPHPGLPAAL